MLSRCGEGELLSDLWMMGIMSGQVSVGSLSSDRRLRADLKISFPSLSTAPLVHGEYGRVKWWLVFRRFARSRSVSFLKCIGESDMNDFGAPNSAHQSTKAVAA